MENIEGLSVRLYGPEAFSGSETISQFFTNALLFLGRKIFEDRYPGEHYAHKNIQQMSGLHVAKDLEGNLARLAFQTSDKALHGIHWVAPSTRATVRIMKNADSHRNQTIVVSSTGNRKQKRIKAVSAHPNYKDQVGLIQPTFRSSNRRQDSEYLLINYLAYYLANQPTDLAGELVITTERVPCKHCTDVIFAFARMYENVRCNIVYFYETEDRDSTALLTADTPSNLYLYKAAMSASGAEATRISKLTPQHRISSRVLDQAEAIDSSAHINSRTRATLSFSLKDIRK
ncbi:deaminase domain-containing protein [Burkholderia gladioli]|uniref:deaminase domain-containing protein n=1 Tax=Burkholderia gladioli TaxID=28095 RepID=UPI0034DB0CBC